MANNIKPNANFGVGDLEPAQWYHLRVTAHNNAGFTVAEYEFATLTVTGGKTCCYVLRCSPLVDFKMLCFITP